MATTTPTTTPPTPTIPAALPVSATAIIAISATFISTARRSFEITRRRRRRAHIGRRHRIIAARTIVFDAQHTARARIGIKPNDAAFRRHPFQTVMRITAFIVEWTVGIVKCSGVAASHLRQHAIERLHTGRTAWLRGGGLQAHRQHGQKRQKH
jgi:hypothetical protein